jgi:hypothetical protein
METIQSWTQTSKHHIIKNINRENLYASHKNENAYLVFSYRYLKLESTLFINIC